MTTPTKQSGAKMQIEIIARAPNLIIIVMAMVGIAFLVKRCCKYWRISTPITKVNHIYVSIALLYNIVLHGARVLGAVAPNVWYLVAVVLLVSALTMREIVDGEGA